MTHDPEQDEQPDDRTEDATPQTEAAETENIKDEGEPLGANLA